MNQPWWYFVLAGLLVGVLVALPIVARYETRRERDDRDWFARQYGGRR